MTNIYNRSIARVLVAGMFFSSATFVSAENASSSPNIAALAAQVQNLLAQVAVLQTELAAAQKEVVSVKQELALTRALAFGSKGKDVSDLQEFLKNFPDIYPEGLITGFFGHATEKAVKRLQEKHGLSSVGIVGPRTREKLHGLFSEHRGRGHGELFVKHGDDNDDDDDENDDDDDGHVFASSTVGMAKIVMCHKPKHKHGGKTITIAVPALRAHIAHGDTSGACRGGGGAGTTTPDTTAPVISNVSASAITAGSAVIRWNTNENADSTVWYGLTNPLDIASTTIATKITNALLGMSHEIHLSGLTASTTHFYVVGSKDASGNQATSSQASFTTL